MERTLVTLRFKDLRHRTPVKNTRRTAYDSAKRCIWCGRSFSRQLPKTKEHLVPVSQGGLSSRSALAAACKPCNSRRGTDTSWRPYTDVEGMPESQLRHLRRLGVL